MNNPQPVSQEPIELVGVKETIAEGGGFWHSCSGCYESNEGAPPNGAIFSTVFQCYLGNGCDECGGLGAVWDNTDYEDIERLMAEQGTAPQFVSQDPEEIKLPVDVTIGCGTVKAGCTLQTLLTRIKIINETWEPKLKMSKELNHANNNS